MLTGIDRTDFKFKFSSGNFRVEIDELAIPQNPVDLPRAMALLTPTADALATTSISPPVEVVTPVAVATSTQTTTDTSSASEDADANLPAGSMFADYLAKRGAQEGTAPVTTQEPAPAVLQEIDPVVVQAAAIVAEPVSDVDVGDETAGVVTAGSLPVGFHRGLCGAGDDVHEADMTLDEAREYCHANPECQGFTYNTVEQEPVGVVHIWFKSQLNLLYDETEEWLQTWWTYSNGRGI